jgi:UDP-N-acetylglucosamine:LPS N-acetylglucosamine transferase
LESEAFSISVLPDCRLSRPLEFLNCVIAAFKLIKDHRPDVVVSTGAAPGLACIVAGRTLGVRTLWIDSLTHNKKLSACGNLAKFVADGCWTQWAHLADGKRLRYFGSVT